MPTAQKEKQPVHVAIIMDGNGRWARQRGLSRLEGHKAGARNIRRVIEICAQLQLQFVTLYAFSTENWNRPALEVNGLFQVLEEMIDPEIQYAQGKNIRFRHLGKLDGLPEKLKRKIAKVLEATQDNTGMTLNIAFNYGGRDEVIEAVRRLVYEKIPLEKIDEATFSRYLYTTGIPDPDLIIRTGGEMRLSNFLIWQSAYAEFYSTSVFWPDFDKKEIEKALAAYRQRQRRFGSIKSGD